MTLIKCKNCGYEYSVPYKKSSIKTDEDGYVKSCPQCTKNFPDSAINGIVKKFMADDDEIDLNKGTKDELNKL